VPCLNHIVERGITAACRCAARCHSFKEISKLNTDLSIHNLLPMQMLYMLKTLVQPRQRQQAAKLVPTSIQVWWHCAYELNHSTVERRVSKNIRRHVVIQLFLLDARGRPRGWPLSCCTCTQGTWLQLLNYEMVPSPGWISHFRLQCGPSHGTPCSEISMI
jgi:hypothetical protein